MALFDFLRRGSNKGAPSPPVRHKTQTAEAPAPPGTANDLARQIAQDTVRQLVALEKVALDFTPMSLSTVEQILDRCSARGMRSSNQNGLVMGLGCYFGEVVRFHARGQWMHHKDTPLAKMPGYPPNFLHLMIPSSEGEQFVNVFNKIAARLDGDRGTSVAAYYKVITTRDFLKESASRSKPA